MTSVWKIEGHEYVEYGQNGKTTGWRKSLTGSGNEYKVNSMGRKTRETRPRSSRIPARVLEMNNRLE